MPRVIIVKGWVFFKVDYEKIHRLKLKLRKVSKNGTKILKKIICPKTKCVVLVVLDSDKRKEKLLQKQHFQTTEKYRLTAEGLKNILSDCTPRFIAIRYKTTL